MKKYDTLWSELNKLLSQLRASNVRKLVDDFYLKYDNQAPGLLLTETMQKLQTLLNEADDQ